LVNIKIKSVCTVSPLGSVLHAVIQVWTLMKYVSEINRSVCDQAHLGSPFLPGFPTKITW